MPFDQNLKRKTVVRPVIDNPNLVRIYVKGAPEVIIPLSKKTFNIDGEEIELKENIKVELLSDSISIDMARNGLKVITYAYKEITL
jgi:magnesium-transporting ATPase (P-type)